MKLICASSIRNGAALRTCHVINSSRSRGRAGTFSNRRRETFATLSGMASATRFGRAPMRSNTCRSASDTAFRSTMFAAFSVGTTAPGGSGSMAWAVTESAAPRDATAAADTRCRAISTATVGSAGERNELFDKRDLIDLAKRRGALQYFLHGRFAQELHALFVGRFLDL